LFGATCEQFESYLTAVVDHATLKDVCRVLHNLK